MNILKNLKLPNLGKTRTEQAERTRTSSPDEANRTKPQSTTRSRDTTSLSREVEEDEGVRPGVGALFSSLSSLFGNEPNPSREILRTTDAVVDADRRADENPRFNQTDRHAADVLAEALANSATEDPDAFATALVEVEERIARARDHERDQGIRPSGGFIGGLALPFGERDQDRVDVMNQALIDASANDPEAAEELFRALQEARVE